MSRYRCAILSLLRALHFIARQSTGFALTFAGYILGHSHAGRAFPPSAHGHFSNFLLLPVLLQLGLGIYLKLHIHEKTLRPYAVIAHGILGRTYPIFGWVQMLFGAIVMGGFCRGGHLGRFYGTFIYAQSLKHDRSMCGSLYHGQRLYRLWDTHGTSFAFW